MGNWIEKYKNLVIPSHKRHVLIADPDNLFDYVELKQAFEEEGFKILTCNSGLEVRLEYELRVKIAGDKFLIIAPASYTPLPDIEVDMHFQSLGLPQLFPNLDPKAIKGLSYNALSLLSNIKLYEELGHEKTLKFLLENLYNIDFDTLTTSKAKERIMNALITVLLERNGINEPLLKFLSQKAVPYFPTLVSSGLNKTNLIQYLQDQWTTFVSTGQSKFDFNEPLLNKSLGYLFVFQHLKPVQVTIKAYADIPKTLRLGVFVDENGHFDNELEGLIAYLLQQLDIIEDIPQQWFSVIQILSNAKVKSILTDNDQLKQDFHKIEGQLNVRFQRFLENTYTNLFSLSGIRHPVVVTRILDHISAKPAQKKALLVIDGMNFWQWNLIGRELTSAGIDYSQNATLAYIPTITAWSRQAIFKGDKPDLSEDNSKEAKLFAEYWKKNKALEGKTGFEYFGISKAISIESLSSNINLLGLVCNDLDEIMHGAVLGNTQLITSTEQWIKKSNIVETIIELRRAGFQIFITSDHGSVEAIGLKNLTLQDKVGAISRGKRHLHFTNDTLLQRFKEQNSTLQVGIKGLSVYIKGEEAFTNESVQVITHGGSHIWEVIVPFITIDEY